MPQGRVSPIRALTALGVTLATLVCSGGDVVLCGRVVPPSYPGTNATFRLYSAVVDSNRVKRILSEAESGEFKYTLRYGFIQSASHLLDLLVFSTSNCAVSKQYCVTMDHISGHRVDLPWGTSGDDEALWLITNRATMVSIMEAIVQEFDTEQSWTNMPLPVCVDLSTVTNRDARKEWGDYLRGDLKKLRTARTGFRYWGSTGIEGMGVGDTDR